MLGLRIDFSPITMWACTVCLSLPTFRGGSFGFVCVQQFQMGVHRCVTLPGHVVIRRGRASVPNVRRVALGRPLFGVGVVGLPTLLLAARSGPTMFILAPSINFARKNNQTLFEHVLIMGGSHLLDT